MNFESLCRDRTTLPWVTSPLHDQPLLPHLIVQSLAVHDDAPCIYLAGRVATYAEVRRRTSQLIQAQRARGVTR
ncbi:MAG: hypothetical protein QOJ66_1945, partial [Ilumatobacteraceae bacterium]